MERRRIPGICVTIGLLVCLFGPSGAQAREDDSTPPTLLSVLLDPVAVDVTSAPKTVHVRVTASDNLSGVQPSIASYLASPILGQTAYMSLSMTSGTPMNGVWEGDITIPVFSEAGDWQLYLALYDAVGNGGTITPQVLAALGFAHTVTVTSLADTTAPTLLSVSFDPLAVDVSLAPATVHVTVLASDDLSGMQLSIASYFMSPAHTQQAYASLSMTSGTPLNGTWEGDIAIPMFGEAGDWQLYLGLYDAVSNGGTVTPEALAALGFPHTVTVTSLTDATAPTLLSVSISPSIVDVTATPATVHVQVAASDDLSGVQLSIASYLDSPSHTQQPYRSLALTSGTPLNGVWEGDITILAFSEAGDWQLYLGLYDAVGNGGTVTPVALSGLGFPHVVRVSTYEVSSVADVGNDQGRHVRVRWGRHPEDAVGATTPVVSYSVWRRIGAYLKDAPACDLSPALYPPGDWDYVKSVPAHGEWSYNTVCETLADSSIVGGQSWSVFFVRAETANPVTFFDTQPDSGWSVDNLPPAPPAGLAGAYASGTTSLQWKASLEADFWYYRLYRGVTESFVPGPANLIASNRAVGWLDVSSGPGFYKLSAVDVNGNESAFASLSPDGISGVPGAGTGFRLLPNQPNPFNPRTTIRFALAAAGPARLAVFDVAGRLVRVLVDSSLPAGGRDVTWDGRDAAGHDVGSGTYVARLESGGAVAVIRMTLVR